MGYPFQFKLIYCLFLLFLAGFAWYIPLGEPRPWRKPLRERQAYASAVDTASRHNREKLLSGEDPEKPVRPEAFLEKSPYGDPDSKPSLQVM